MQIDLADRLPGDGLGLFQGRHQNADQERYDGDDDEQLDEREGRA